MADLCSSSSRRTAGSVWTYDASAAQRRVEITLTSARPKCQLPLELGIGGKVELIELTSKRQESEFVVEQEPSLVLLDQIAPRGSSNADSLGPAVGWLPPFGEVANDHPLVTTTEVWRSTELKVTVPAAPIQRRLCSRRRRIIR